MIIYFYDDNLPLDDVGSIHDRLIQIDPHTVSVPKDTALLVNGSVETLKYVKESLLTELNDLIKTLDGTENKIIFDSLGDINE